MKKAFLPIIAIALAVGSTSCKKVRTCECSTTTTIEESSYTNPITGEKTIITPASTETTTDSGPTLTSMSKKDGKTYCESLSDSETYSGGSYTSTCTMKE